MKKIFVNLWNNHKKKHQKQLEYEQTSAFNITEKNGVIYIMAGQRAIQKIPKELTAKEILIILEDCRNAQLEFNKKY